MPHFANEIWLNIIAHCDDNRALWQSLRRANSQLKACVEQHFAEQVLPNLTVALPMTLPTYDARNPIRGEATFRSQKPLRGTPSTMVIELVETGPEFHLSHFLGRWAGMKDVDGGWMRESVEWNMSMDEGVVFCGQRLKAARAVTEDVEEDEAWIEFEWKATLTGFYR